jgi:hypothetical protein
LLTDAGPTEPGSSRANDLANTHPLDELLELDNRRQGLMRWPFDGLEEQPHGIDVLAHPSTVAYLSTDPQKPEENR